MSDISIEGKIGYSTDAEFGPNDILYMLKDLPDACCIFKVLTDPFGTVKDMLFLFANEKYAKLAGKPTAELIGATYYSTVKNQDEDWIKFSYQAAILRQSSINRTYNTHFDKWFEFWAVPVYQKGFCAFIIHDVTADKRNEESRVLQTNSSNLVIDCAKALSTSDFSKGIKRVLGRIGAALEADRVYIVRENNGKIEQIYEWISKSCSTELPSKKVFEKYDMVSIWSKQLSGKDVFVMNDTTPIMELNPTLYNEFLAGKCSRYIVATLKEKDGIMGFLVADNYSLDIQLNITEVMETVAAFIATNIKNHDLTTELIYLGGHDALTGLGNRYALNQTLMLLAEFSTSVGVCYTDINGLKIINDEKGHQVGDKLIIETAGLVAGVFKKKNCFRVGGDEFIAVVQDVEKEKFEELVEKLRQKAKGVSIAIGYDWNKDSSLVDNVIKKADETMYKDKAAYYKTHERRHNG